ncbi:diacylglycerol kinase [Photobacterium arenosum]|uniref:diacylglycerol kinase n=1 Tax=Photobacterium arenosum TaxID=2774143 RepID=UPI00288B31B3|nr:diacylglycerol kinase [Photobacterium arenosum]
MKEKEIIKRTGLTRILYTFVHSYNGFKWLVKNEAAFQQELILFIPLSIIAFVLPFSDLETIFILISMLFVLFSEMVNSAIETVVDRVGLEFHPLSGVAKNIGSAIVLLSIMMSLMVWSTLIWTNFTS